MFADLACARVQSDFFLNVNAHYIFLSKSFRPSEMIFEIFVLDNLKS